MGGWDGEEDMDGVGKSPCCSLQRDMVLLARQLGDRGRRSGVPILIVTPPLTPALPSLLTLALPSPLALPPPLPPLTLTSP